ncbi:6-bladed beta-propeller [Acidobacteriota bacterium]
MLFVIYCLFLSGCAKGWQGRMYTDGGVEVTENTGRSIYGDRFAEILELRETLILGQEKVSEEYTFYSTPLLTVDDNLNIYVFDRKESHLRKYDRNGTFLWQTGRSGQGPGEFQFADDLALDGDGSIFILDRHIAVHEFDTKGAFKRTLNLDRRCWNLDVLPDGRLFLNLFLEGRHGVSSYFYSSEGLPLEPFREEYTYASYAQGQGGISPDKARRLLDGHIFFSLPDQYEIRKYTIDGTLKRIIRRSLLLDPFNIRQEAGRKFISVKDRSGPCYLWREGILINVMTRSRGSSALREWRMDFFDRDGRFIGSSLLPDYRFLNAVDQEGNLYFVESLPYPRIIRCETNLVPFTKAKSE